MVCFFGKSSTFEIKLSSAVFLLGGGIKSLLFLTIEISVSSVPSKYSASLSFLLNSLKSSYIYIFLTSPVQFLLYFQNHVRHLNQNFREVRKIYKAGMS